MNTTQFHSTSILTCYIHLANTKRPSPEELEVLKNELQRNAALLVHPFALELSARVEEGSSERAVVLVVKVELRNELFTSFGPPLTALKQLKNLLRKYDVTMFETQGSWSSDD